VVETRFLVKDEKGWVKLEVVSPPMRDEEGSVGVGDNSSHEGRPPDIMTSENGPANRRISSSGTASASIVSITGGRPLKRARKHRRRLARLARLKSNIFSFTLFIYLKEKK
jgi:hypothetical protein